MNFFVMKAVIGAYWKSLKWFTLQPITTFHLPFDETFVSLILVS